MIISVWLSFALPLGAAALPLSKLQVEEKLKSFKVIKSIEASFLQIKWLKEADVELKSNGEFKLVSPHSENYVLTWEIKKPRPALVTLARHKVTMASGQGLGLKTKTFDMATLGGAANQDLASMGVWLRLNPDEVLKEFEVTEESDHLVLAPKEPKKSPFSKIQIYLAPNGYFKKVELFEKSGDKLLTEFFNVRIK